MHDEQTSTAGSVLMSNSTVGSSSSSHLEQVADYLSLVANLVMIVVGNVTLLVYINSRKRSRMTYFITNLGAADLCVGIFVVLPQFIDRLLRQFYGPLFLCKLRWFLQIVIEYEASYALVALSIDGVDAIANPLRASMSGKGLKSACIICGSWILSSLHAIPSVLSAQIMQHSRYGRQCTLMFGSSGNATKLQQRFYWQMFVTYSLITMIIIPVTIVAVCHIALVLVIFKSSRGPNGAGHRAQESRHQHQHQHQQHQKQHHQQQQQLQQQCSSACPTGRRILTRAKVKSVKITCTIVSVFILCWLPYTIGSFLDAWRPILSANAKIIIQTLGTLNSAVNPIIFFIFNHNQCCSKQRSANRSRGAARGVNAANANNVAASDKCRGISCDLRRSKGGREDSLDNSNRSSAHRAVELQLQVMESSPAISSRRASCCSEATNSMRQQLLSSCAD